MLFLTIENEKLFEKAISRTEIEDKITGLLNKIKNFDDKVDFLSGIEADVLELKKELIKNKKGQYETTNLDIDQQNKQVNHKIKYTCLF